MLGRTCVPSPDCARGNEFRHLKVTPEGSSLSGDKYLEKVGKPRPSDKISHLKEEGAEQENQPVIS